MGLLNGLNGLAAGVGTVAAKGMKDSEEQDAAKEEAAARASLMNRTPPADVVQTPLPNTAPATPAASDNGATQSVVPTPSGGVISDVPAALLPIYQKAAVRTGIPVSILIAQSKQESGFNPNAVGSAGEIGLMQIKPSTAADPGYGMKGIDPATLKDPVVNINFGADYLRARAGGSGVDFSNPANVDKALVSYNGGGDKNYAANVRSHL